MEQQMDNEMEARIILRSIEIRVSQNQGCGLGGSHNKDYSI